MNTKTPQDVLKLAKEKGARFVDFRFVDLFGIEQHKTHPIHQLEEKTFTEGTGFDGSSIRGFQAINESDMLHIPDPSSAFMDPFAAYPTLVMSGNIVIPKSFTPYSRDARYVAQKAEAYLKTTGIADTSYWGPELEFFVFDNVRYGSAMHQAFYFVDSEEGFWNTGAEEGPNLGYKIPAKRGYFPVPPADSQQDLRCEMVATLEEIGVPVELHHHEVATAGQAEIDMRFDTLTAMGDKVLKYKYVVKNVARKYGKTATFMPKPMFGDNGSGMHTHQSLWKDGKPLFAGDKYGGLSELALYYIGGLLTHAPAVAAFTNPSTNSYKRLVPGFEAPVNLVFSARNRSASIRIPTYSTNPKAIRIEYRPPDGTSNPYLAMAAMLMAGIDGIKRKIDPTKAGFGPLDKNIYELSTEEKAAIKGLPGSLEESLQALEADHQFLLEGDVFTKDLIDTYIDHKRNQEAKPASLRPTPFEYELYFDC